MGTTYCSRCARTFSSLRALQQHYGDSDHHHRCEECGFDGSTWEKFLEHQRQTQHLVVCQGCNGGDGAAWVPESHEYLNHLMEHNVCTTCEEHFRSPSNLENHKIVHLERSIECYGCYRKFPTYPAMVLHLDAGTCSSNITSLDLNESAALCYQWKGYVDKAYRSELLDRCDLGSEYSEPVYPFRCPECNTTFTKLSGLFQHVYSNVCDQGLHEGKMGKLIRWLELQHDVGEGE